MSTLRIVETDNSPFAGVTITEADSDAQIFGSARSIVIAEQDTGIPGPQGEQGVPGVPGGSYTHDQAVASSDWTIVHSLGYNPSVSIVDSGGSLVFGEVIYVDENTVALHFVYPFGGKAYLS